MAFTFTTCRMRYSFATLAECSETYSNIRQGLGLGASKLLPAAIYQDGKRIGHISYNGRVWAGRLCDWTPSTPLLFDNRVPA